MFYLFSANFISLSIYFFRAAASVHTDLLRFKVLVLFFLVYMHHTEGETDDIYVMITRRKMPQLYIGHPKSGRGPHSSFKVLEQMLLSVALGFVSGVLI